MREELLQVAHLELPILVGDGEAAGPVLAHVGLLDQAQRGRHGRQPPRALRSQRRHVHHQQARVRRRDGQPALCRAVDRRMRPALLGEGEGLRVLQPPARPQAQRRVPPKGHVLVLVGQRHDVRDRRRVRRRARDGQRVRARQVAIGVIVAALVALQQKGQQLLPGDAPVRVGVDLHEQPPQLLRRAQRPYERERAHKLANGQAAAVRHVVLEVALERDELADALLALADAAHGRHSGRRRLFGGVGLRDLGHPFGERWRPVVGFVLLLQRIVIEPGRFDLLEQRVREPLRHQASQHGPRLAAGRLPGEHLALGKPLRLPHLGHRVIRLVAHEHDRRRLGGRLGCGRRRGWHCRAVREPLAAAKLEADDEVQNMSMTEFVLGVSARSLSDAFDS